MSDVLDYSARGMDWKNASARTAMRLVRSRRVMTREAGKARGILRSPPGPGTFHHARIAPSPMLAGIVQHFWIVRWDLRGHEPHRPETLPHPNVHLLLE